MLFCLTQLHYFIILLISISFPYIYSFIFGRIRTYVLEFFYPYELTYYMLSSTYYNLYGQLKTDGYQFIIYDIIVWHQRLLWPNLVAIVNGSLNNTASPDRLPCKMYNIIYRIRPVFRIRVLLYCFRRNVRFFHYLEHARISYKMRIKKCNCDDDVHVYIIVGIYI